MAPTERPDNLLYAQWQREAEASARRRKQQRKEKRKAKREETR
jgi:hypothetical protein